VKGRNKFIIRAGLETLFFSGAHLMMRPFTGGLGVILTMHHVRPARFGGFQPNRLLEVAPEFFARLVRKLRKSRIDLVSLDEMHRRLTEQDFGRRFVCLTFDDGYRDFLEHALPVLKAHDAPFAMYVPTSFPDRIGELWWLGLEEVIARNGRIGMLIDGREQRFDCGTTSAKRELFDQLYWYLRSRNTEEELRAVVRDLCVRYGVDMKALCERLCMTWPEVTELSQSPLATIGAHTVNHVILGKVADKVVRSEMEMGRSVLEAAIGVRPKHFAYPVGDASAASEREFRIATELGFKTAVTTQPGVLFPEHRDHLTALPRISVNGEFQRMRYMNVLMSGAPTAMMSGFRKVKAA
jgi:peptidoglycan/xylan/chitin deacetylase (PgdA/CDA1 family)